MPHHGLFAALPIRGGLSSPGCSSCSPSKAAYCWARKKRRSEVEKEAPVGAMVAVLGLFAFIQTDRSASALVRVSSDTP